MTSSAKEEACSLPLTAIGKRPYFGMGFARNALSSHYCRSQLTLMARLRSNVASFLEVSDYFRTSSLRGQHCYIQAKRQMDSLRKHDYSVHPTHLLARPSSSSVCVFKGDYRKAMSSINGT